MEKKKFICRFNWACKLRLRHVHGCLPKISEKVPRQGSENYTIFKTAARVLHHLNTCNSLKCLVETVQNSYQLFSKFSERCSWQSADIQLGSHLWRIILRGVIIYTRTKTGVNLNEPQDHVHFPTENSYKPSTFICLKLKLLSWINFTTKN